MITAEKPLVSLTAEDLMSAPVEVISQEMPLRAAARLLTRAYISGAPVVDAQGRCVGVLSAVDFLHWTGKDNDFKTSRVRQPLTCGFQLKHKVPNGTNEVLCSLPPGVCSLQEEHQQPDGTSMIVCSQPHSIPCDWQVVEMDDLPTGEVRQHMTADPVVVAPATGITSLAT